MLARGYTAEFAASIYSQIQGFAEYGFPESHAASFALLAYASAWLKCHHPAAFLAALLNSQPMGFYAPAQIVRDAREHGVDVRPPDVNASSWLSVLEPGGALRLGLSQVKEILGLRIFYSAGPMLLYLTGILLVWGYPITAAMHAQLLEALACAADDAATFWGNDRLHEKLSAMGVPHTAELNARAAYEMTGPMRWIEAWDSLETMRCAA